MAKHWHRLLREAVDTPTVETFKARLDKALSSTARGRGLALDDFWSSFPTQTILRLHEGDS